MPDTSSRYRKCRSRFPIVGGTAIVLACLLPGGALGADFSVAEQILESGTLGGTRGLRVRRVGAPTAAFSRQGSYVFYPASTIKVLEHLYAMTLIDQGTWDLFGTTPSICTTSTNCSSASNGGSCGAQEWWLFTVVQQMMRVSSNRATNAIQEEVGREFFPQQADPAAWGRFLMTGFAHANVGMPDTELEHKLGCGGPCQFDPANRLTLVDIEALYEDIAINAAVLSPGMRLTLHDTMLNEANSFVNSVVNQEAASTGRTQYRDAFKAKIFMIFKDGNQDCSGKDHRSSAGLIQLPTHGGTYKRLHTWGVFTDESQVEFYLPGTMAAATRELLRYPIRAALLTWGNFWRAQQAGTLLTRVEALPAHQEATLIGDLVREAGRALLGSQDALDQTERDYGTAVAELKAAVERLEQARNPPPTLRGGTGEPPVPEELVEDVVALARELVLDAAAVAYMTSDATALATVLASMETDLAEGGQSSAGGLHTAAVGHYADAATLGSPLVDWASRGPASEDTASGFVGSSGWIYGDDFETGDFSFWPTRAAP